MIEPLKMINEGISQRVSMPGLVQTINELIDSVNALEAIVYGSDDDARCCDCHELPADDDKSVTDEVQKVVDDVRSKNQPREIDTTDGLFSDFTAYVADHPGLRFGQAVTNFTGFRKV